MKGKFIVITGPSAAGKTMLVDKLLKLVPRSARLITVTTRAPRPNEEDGNDYFFVTRDEFKKRLTIEALTNHLSGYQGKGVVIDVKAMFEAADFKDTGVLYWRL